MPNGCDVHRGAAKYKNLSTTNEVPEVSEREQWHLDKRVPISLIIVIAVQTGGMIWFMSNLASRVEANTEAIARVSQNAASQD